MSLDVSLRGEPVTAPKERPIIFSGPMVRAILEGRKTQTRRVIPCQPKSFGPPMWWLPIAQPRPASVEAYQTEALRRCKYGAPGDRLWVRETWVSESCSLDGNRLLWRADRAARWYSDPCLMNGEIFYLDNSYEPEEGWSPSIYMPRWASRITLEVVAVRVERLQQISEADARAEGLSVLTKDGGQTWKWGLADRDGLPGTDDDGMAWGDWSTDARKPFALGWDKINGKRAPWESNPWVWVVEFRRVVDRQMELVR